MRQRPEQYGYLPDGASTSIPHSGEDSSRESLKLRGIPDQGNVTGFTAREAMRTPAFWLLSVGHAMALFTVGAVSLHLIPHIIDSVGLSITSASSAVVVMTIFNILGQLGGGILSHLHAKIAKIFLV